MIKIRKQPASTPFAWFERINKAKYGHIRLNYLMMDEGL